MKKKKLISPEYSDLGVFAKKTGKTVRHYIVEAAKDNFDLFYYLEEPYQLKIGDIEQDEEGRIHFTQHKMLTRPIFTKKTIKEIGKKKKTTKQNGLVEVDKIISLARKTYIQIHPLNAEYLINQHHAELRFVIYSILAIDGGLGVIKLAGELDRPIPISRRDLLYQEEKAVLKSYYAKAGRPTVLKDVEKFMEQRAIDGHMLPIIQHEAIAINKAYPWLNANVDTVRKQLKDHHAKLLKKYPVNSLN